MRAPDLDVTVNFHWSGANGNDTIGNLGDSATGAGAITLGLFRALKVNSAQSTLTAADARTRKTAKIVQGSSSGADVDVLSLLGNVSDATASNAAPGSRADTAGSVVSGLLSAGANAAGTTPAKDSDPYVETAEGKTVAAALIDAYNKLVVAVRAMPPLPSVAAASPPDKAHAGRMTKAKVAVLDYPASDGQLIEDLPKGTLVNLTDRERDGWTEIVDGDQWGWVPSKQLKKP